MFRRIFKVAAKTGNAVLPALMMTLVIGSVAYALDAPTGGGITLQNGNITLNEGMTGDCSPSAGNALKWADSTGVLSCQTITVADPVTTAYAFSSETPIDLDSGGTIYLGAGGGVSSSFVNVGVPVSGGTFQNLRCAASADPAGTSLKANFVVDACSTAAPTAQADLQIDDLTTAGQADTNGEVTVSDNQCVGIILTDTGNTAAVNVRCSFERTS